MFVSVILVQVNIFCALVLHCEVISRLVGRLLICWLVGWLVGSLFRCFVGQLFGRLVSQSGHKTCRRWYV
jgi:hypothetical protein